MIDSRAPDYESLTVTAENLLARMELLSGSAVIETARAFWLWASTASMALAEAQRSDSNRDEFVRRVRQAYAECVGAMREDLDLPTEAKSRRRHDPTPQGRQRPRNVRASWRLQRVVESATVFLNRRRELVDGDYSHD